MNNSHSVIGKSATRDYTSLAGLLESLKHGDKIFIRKILRINSLNSWIHQVQCEFSHVNHLSTGLATDRVPQDDVVLVCVHFRKPNGELGSVILDDYTHIEKI